MALSENFRDRVSSNLASAKLLPTTSALVIAYCMAQVVYRLKFHPLSKNPGPRLAAVTGLWWAYVRYALKVTHQCTAAGPLRQTDLGVFRITGRYPWVIEDALRQYGDVVRIGPNELVFLTPKAAKDIYLAVDKNLELFVQVGYDALDTGDGGISGETDPVRHREIAKKLAPAFSTRNLKAKEATIIKHIDLFIERMKEVGTQGKGADMQRWSDWLALDLSADMTYGREMDQMRDLKDSVLLSGTLKLNLFVTMSEVTRKFRLLTPLMYLTIPPRASSAAAGRSTLDYFEQLVPADAPVPEDRKHIYHLENVAAQLLLASWMPLADQFYSLIFFLLGAPDAHAALVQEVRSAFATPDAITTDSAATLKYLQACQRESLRLHQATVDGLPRVSPGAVVDGQYIPKGVICQISYIAAARSSRYFSDPLQFHPERWLPADHSRFDPAYKDDNLAASKPFSQGPRGCPGGAIAMTVIRLFIAKTLWHFDLEAAPGYEDLSFEKDFKWLTFWERPPFWVRFSPAQAPAIAEK
ncbi:hypothetical protein PG985_009616 [Apiospora marii]|uniref:uncharacterized protein n=1 Tax=Apiospora marii TaxID=335849 RepID=UPI003131EB60